MALPNTFLEFEAHLSQVHPPKDWPETLKSLWFAAKGDWEASHNIAQEVHTRMGSWIHAYLHRVEGDRWNAGYWYRQAGKPYPEVSLEKELQNLVEAHF